MAEPLLSVRDLRTQFFTREGVVHAVDGVSFDVEKGRTLGIVGESGCGKTVTALSIMGLLPKPPAGIVGGEAIFGGRDLAASPSRELEDVRGKRDRDDLPGPDDVAEPDADDRDADHGDGPPPLERLEAGRAPARGRAARGGRDAEGCERLDDYPHRLSGGMRQRVMIAIAISCDPALLIADEPTTALDVTVQAQVLDLLADMRDAHDMAMIVITHDMGVVADAADDVLVMYAGQVVEQAPVLELFDRPEHPYTEALLGALPQIEDPGVRHRRLTAIPGRPPDLLDPPETCRFAARCKYAGGDACTQHMPELRELRPGHLVRSEHPASERVGAREKVVT